MVRDKSNLPFEVEYSQKPSSESKTSSSMKRLAVILKPENVDSITSTLRGLGLESTIYDVKGSGKEKERVSSGRGGGTIDLQYTTRRLVATVVKSDDVEDIIDRMKKALGGGSGAVVMMQPVDDLVRL
ncbi:MAG TPA: P-II family nitrogen regulator [Nitrososphaera sp.]|jgi:nitrogen regulatory protein PII|nr:P-II family nitrogen regulator [Nitrososphaera sp.]